MILACDIGNTNVVIGVYDHGWKYIWRIETRKEEKMLYYSILVNNLLWEAGIDATQIDYISMSTVVPELKEIFKKLFRKLIKNPVYILENGIFNVLPLTVQSADEIGTDLVANCLAANLKYKDNILIIDFGTALTFTVVDKNGVIIGVNIAPGIKIALGTLMSKTSQLPMVDISFPLDPLGKNTTEAIQNGVLLGYVGLVKYMIKVLQNYLDFDFKVIATGGLSSLIHPHIGEFDYIDKNLTLEGLLKFGEIMEGQ